jgi:hypothetical protein
MDTLKPQGKPFAISKWEVWEAYRQVKANKGAPGVDGGSLEDFDKDLKGNLYKIWNRMASGSYLPPPVLAVEIPKPHGGGTRVLGVPTIADRIAQTVVARRLEEAVEPIFHPDSYGYRPGRSALDAVAVCRRRCWAKDWVIDLDVERFFDSVPWELLVKAVAAHTDQPWVVLYVIPEGAGTVNPNDEDRLDVVGRSVRRGGQPSARRRGQRVEAPQRSEDERPRASRADAGCKRRRSSCLGRWPPSGRVSRWVAAPSPATAGCGQPERLGCRSSLRRARRHGAVRPQPGGLNQAGDHATRWGS